MHNLSSNYCYFVSKGMFRKGANDRFLLSEEERLTHDSEEIMAVYVF